MRKPRPEWKVQAELLPSKRKIEAAKQSRALRKAFAAALDAAITKKRISEVDAAYLAGIDNAAINKYRKNQREPSVSKALLLAGALGFSLDKLLMQAREEASRRPAPRRKRDEADAEALRGISEPPDERRETQSSP